MRKSGVMCRSMAFVIGVGAASVASLGAAQDTEFDDLFGPTEQSSSSSSSSGSSAEPYPANDQASEEQAASSDQASDDGAESSSEPTVSEQATDASSGPVYDVVPVADVQAEPEPEGAVAPPQRAKMLEEIVVTARKREETVQDVPLAVTAFNAGVLEQRGFNGLEDIAAATPGFTFEGFMSGGAHGNAVIRGLAEQFTTSRIQNVSFFLDGVYLQRQSMLNLGLIDMERVEVLKGPQNALFGRNAFGGAVNYITLRPSQERTGYLMAGAGDNERQEYRVSLSGPLDDAGVWLGKFTAGLSSYDGHTKNMHPVANADPSGPNLRGNLGGWDDATYSLSLTYQPNDDLTVRGSFYRSELERETGAGYSISGVGAARFGLRFDDQNDLNCNTATVQNIGDPSKTHTGYTAYCGELPDYASDIAPRTVNGMVVDPRAIGTIAETSAITLTVDYNINPDLSVHYLYGLADHSSYTDGGASDEDPLAGRGIVTNALITAIDTQNRAGYSFANTASSRPNSVLESFSHELRFDWQVNERLRTSFGAYYSVVEDEEWTALFINDLCNADTQENIDNCNEPLSADNTLDDRTVLTAGVAYDQYTRQHGGKIRGEWTAYKDTISAIFGSVSFDFTDTIDGTLEARYTVEDKVVDRYTDASALRPGETVTYNPPQDPVLPFVGNSITSSIVVPHDTARFRDITPRAILSWDYADGHMVYVSAAKGVKTGGFNNADSESEQTYDESVNWTYELGSKNSFFGRSMTLNGAIYLIDWTGLQGGVPPAVAGLSTSDIITNIGGATSFGVEVEANAYLTDWFSIDVGLTYNDATYDKGVKYSAGIQDTGRFHCDGVTCPADGDVGGNQLARTSKEQYSLGLNVFTDIFDWPLTMRVDTNYQSKQYVTPLNLAWAPERQITNASFSLKSADYHWEFSGWCKNLTDEDYAANAFFIGVFNQYMVGKGAGRTIGATMKYNF